MLKYKARTSICNSTKWPVSMRGRPPQFYSSWRHKAHGWRSGRWCWTWAQFSTKRNIASSIHSHSPSATTKQQRPRFRSILCRCLRPLSRASLLSAGRDRWEKWDRSEREEESRHSETILLRGWSWVFLLRWDGNKRHTSRASHRRATSYFRKNSMNMSRKWIITDFPKHSFSKNCMNKFHIKMNKSQNWRASFRESIIR